GRVVAAINAGGPALTQDGINFSADTSFLGGSFTYTDGVSDPDEPAFNGTIYETERWGGGSGLAPVQYSIPVAPGSYTVELYFAEIIQSLAAGQRVFDVQIEGQSVLKNFDILAQTNGNASQPVVIKVPNTFSPNTFGAANAIDISFTGSVANAKVAGIVIRDATPVPPPTPFSGYGLFSLQTGLPDLVSLIVEKPSVNLDLKDKNAFQFVGTKPKDKPQDKKIGQFGTTGLEFGHGVAVDPNGNTYVTGTTSGSLFGPNQGSGDIWLAKYDKNGNQVKGLQFGSAGGDSVYQVVTDKAGNFYLAGSTGGSFVAGKQSTGGTDAWVAKYDPNGNLLWGRQIGEGSLSPTGEKLTLGFSTSGFGLQVDDNGNVYISGLSIKENPPPRALDFDVQDDSWVMKFDSNGKQQWFTQIKDPNQPAASPLATTPFFDESYDLAVDKNGNSYLVGWTQGLAKESDPGRDLLKYDAWLSKVDTNGKVVWTQQFGSTEEPGKTGLDFAWGVDTDSQGNIYVTGWTTGTVGSQNYGSYDVWLTKFTPTGTQVWAKQIGTKGDDGQFQSDIVIDAFDNIFVSGYTNNKLGSGSSDPAGNAWVGKFDTNGNNQWIQLLGVKDKADYATGLAVNNAGQVIVTGFTEGFLGTANNTGAQGAAVDAWVAQLAVKDGKLQNFIGNTGNVITISNPAPIASVDISNKLVTAAQLPNGDNVIKGTNVDYGSLLTNLAPAFDPRNSGSVPAALAKTLGNSFNSNTKVDYKGTDNDDVYFGGSADDKLSSGKGNDVLYGLAGNDKLDGGEGNDILHGGVGNDEVSGGKGNDIIYGVDFNSAKPGLAEIDTLKGDDGADLFVLGSAKQIYYLGNGKSDYALINDLKLDQGDKIQLSQYTASGSTASYSLQTDIAGLPKGTGIFANGDLIGIVKDVKGLSLSNKSVFTYV
ncbi:MAG: SBBP repeat-containing protein, partial [Kovacikia sp.]